MSRTVAIKESIQTVKGYPKKLVIYLTPASKFYWTRVFYLGKYHTRTTKTTDPKQACELARQESKNFVSPLSGGTSLISDGFAGTLKEVNQSDRDKLRKYWECWFETRNVDDVNVGAKGIDLGAL